MCLDGCVAILGKKRLTSAKPSCFDSFFQQPPAFVSDENRITVGPQTSMMFAMPEVMAQEKVHCKKQVVGLKLDVCRIFQCDCPPRAEMSFSTPWP